MFPKQFLIAELFAAHESDSVTAELLSYFDLHSARPGDCVAHCDQLLAVVDAQSDESLPAALAPVNDSAKYWDDLSGKALRSDLVHKARLEEMSEIAKHGVYVKVPISECWNATGRAPRPT